MTRSQITWIGLGVAGTVVTAVLHFTGVSPTVRFIVAALALAALAAVVGRAVEQVGSRLAAGATGVLQATLGNLPELFVSIFALRAGLVELVKASLIGSILANSLLVLGSALLVGGLRHGTQHFRSQPPRLIATLMLLAVAALTVPTLAHLLHVPASHHEVGLSVACALILLALFALSVPYRIRGGAVDVPNDDSDDAATWPLWLAIVVLAGASLAASFVSDWFVDALQPAIATLHLSEAFTGLVVVAIASNAVENVVGIQLAAANKADYAVSVILNSPLQIAIGLIPALVLLSLGVGQHHLTLVLKPLLLAALALTSIITTVIVYDGESIWLEGAALIGVYGIVAASFWWG